MSCSVYRILLITAFLHTAYGLYGPNVCTEQQNYTMTTRVKYQQPVSVKTYKWCLGIPPRCSVVHTEMREKWKVQTMTKTKNIEFCCKGFEEDEGRCVPKCPAGFTGDLCDQGCPLEKWGPSCTEDCECPENSICNVKNGSCICLEGWFGASCDLPLLPATRMPFPRIDKEVLKNTHLFNWNPPTMADIQTTEKDVTFRNMIITNTPKVILLTTSTDKQSSKNSNNITTTSIKPVVVSKVTLNVTTPASTTTTRKSISISTAGKIIATSSTKQNAPKINLENITTTVFNTTPKKLEIITSDSIPTVKYVVNLVNENNFTTDKAVILSTETVQLHKFTKPNVNKNDQHLNSNISTKGATTIGKNIDLSVDTTDSYNNANSITSVKDIKTENFTESVDDKHITLKTITLQKSQIESPTSIASSTTTISPVKNKITEESFTKDSNEKDGLTVTTKTYSSTTKRKPIKTHKSESEILNITLHTFSSNKDTGSRIFKTITLPPTVNTTLKTSQQKVKVLHESKMITIPVRVIMDSEKSPSNIYLKKSTNGSTKTDFRKFNNKFVTSSPMFTIDVQTEETKHVLTEPEQITSIAGNDDEFENRDNLLSIMTISIGVMLVIILTATIIVLVTRYRQIKAEKLKNVEMDHVQSMMNVSEDEIQSGYLRSTFHSPLPDPPSQIITITNKPPFSVPFIQSTLSRPVTPALMESFRDILECHYDHPKPPRPASIATRIQINTQQIAPPIYQHLNTFRTSSAGTNQSVTITGDVSLPVTDAAINVLKLEYQNSQPVGMENREPDYDEIPPWISNRSPNVNKNMYSNDEAVTEL